MAPPALPLFLSLFVFITTITTIPIIPVAHAQYICDKPAVLVAGNDFLVTGFDSVSGGAVWGPLAQSGGIPGDSVLALSPDGQVAYLNMANNKLCAYAVATGQQQWCAVDLVNNQAATFVLLDPRNGDLLFFAYPSQDLVRVSALDGSVRQRWTNLCPGQTGNLQVNCLVTAVLANGDVLVQPTSAYSLVFPYEPQRIYGSDGHVGLEPVSNTSFVVADCHNGSSLVRITPQSSALPNRATLLVELVSPADGSVQRSEVLYLPSNLQTCDPSISQVSSVVVTSDDTMVLWFECYCSFCFPAADHILLVMDLARFAVRWTQTGYVMPQLGAPGSNLLMTFSLMETPNPPQFYEVVMLQLSDSSELWRLSINGGQVVSTAVFPDGSFVAALADGISLLQSVTQAPGDIIGQVVWVKTANPAPSTSGITSLVPCPMPFGQAVFSLNFRQGFS